MDGFTRLMGGARDAGRAGRRSGPRAVAVLFAAGSVLLNACAGSETTTKDIELTSPRTTGGLIIHEPGEDGLRRIAMAMDRLSEPDISPAVLDSIRERAEERSYGSSVRDRSQSSLSRAVAASSLAEPEHNDIAPELPDDASRLITLERLSRFELREILTAMSMRFQATESYRPAENARAELLGVPPAGVSHGPVLSRRGPDGRTLLLRLGTLRFASQLPQLWAQGVAIAADGTLTANPDLDLLPDRVTEALAQVREMRQGLSNSELDRQIIKLSYISPAAALNSLKGMGINTIDQIQGIPASVEFAQLPLVTQMPGPAAGDIGLLGDREIRRGTFGVTTATNAAELPAEINVTPGSQLMVLFHPAHPEQLSTVRTLLEDYIDRPARQIFVEGMVLEISEDGLQELGVEWEFKDGPVNLLLGSLDPRAIQDTVTFSALDSRDLARDWGVKVRALVRDGKAEILSRPSILTIDNRQASIRVGEDIPIATSQEGALNTNKIAFSFSYIPTGILLNIRPRMTESGNEISMLVDTIVSAQVPGRDLEIRSSQGDLLASAPTISTRRVQTYARIENKTPFIIGGLVSRDRTVINQKVPLLGDLPLIGNAFKSQRTSNQKREVIIVLTPYVLPEQNRVTTRNIPKDDDLFDNTGNRLFRDAHRIRGEDVFDLRFLSENRRLSLYRRIAEDVINSNFRMARAPGFRDFHQKSIPGEEMLVQRMIYEVIRRTRVDERIDPERMIYFEEEQYEGYQVRFLNDVLRRLGDGVDMRSFFERNTGKAVAITYYYDRRTDDIRQLAQEPIPEIALVDCPDRRTWSQLLWELNQPTPDGRERRTILLQTTRDLDRLRRAMMMKQVILLNADDEILNLKNFTIGKVLHMPDMDEDKITVIDSEVARYFFVSELYYNAVIQKIEQTLEEIDRAIEDPEVRAYITRPELIPTPQSRIGD
ncbi:MAG: hypothetical protein LAT64_14330 [Phycisphaerales bacterium]|nr:hypothetical protein [Planctomycetota bacterium]MCH8509928.1 hypothetical protein [Phycisphaerales bacterium]